MSGNGKGRSRVRGWQWGDGGSGGGWWRRRRRRRRTVVGKWCSGGVRGRWTGGLDRLTCEVCMRPFVEPGFVVGLIFLEVCLSGEFAKPSVTRGMYL